MPLSEEDLKQVTGLLNETINGAVGNLKRQDESKRKKDFDELKASLGQTIGEQIAAAVKAAAPAEGEPAGGEPNAKGRKDREIETLRQQGEQTRRELQAQIERANAAEVRRRAIERKTLVDQALALGGVSDSFTRETVIALFDSRGNVPWTEGDDPQLVWRDHVSGNESNFQDGMAAWLKGEEAKRFLPPTGSRGSGSRPSAAGSPYKNMTPDERQRAVRQRLGEELDKALG
jgi:hypothetical protein